MTDADAEVERIARRLFEAVNGTDLTAMWAPGGWDGFKRYGDGFLILNFYAMAREVVKLIEEAREKAHDE